MASERHTCGRCGLSDDSVLDLDTGGAYHRELFHCITKLRQHVERLQLITDAERAVIEAAEAFGVDPWRGDLEGTVVGVSMEYDANGTYVLYEDVLPIIEAVRALRTARGDA